MGTRPFYEKKKKRVSGAYYNKKSLKKLIL